MTDAVISRRVIWLTRLLGVGGLALMGSTWKLWTPQDAFPRVPLFWWAPPHGFDWIALAIALVGLFSLACSLRPPCQGRGSGGGLESLSNPACTPPAAPPLLGRRGYGLFVCSVFNPHLSAAIAACGFALLFLSDQHRLQPWAWQFFVLAIVRAVGDERTVFFGWRWLVVSIYAWSAWSKFSSDFLNETGSMLLRPWQALWLQDSKWLEWLTPLNAWQTRWLLWRLPWLLPGGELAVAGLLAFGRSQRWGMYGSWLMHLGLLVLLGPWGLNHSRGVLLWNAFFIVQNLLLFQPSSTSDAATEPAVALASWTRQGWLWPTLAWMWLAFVVTWPAGVATGACDSWLGWAVYAPRTSGVLWRYRTLPKPLPEPIREADQQANGPEQPAVFTWRGTHLMRRWSLNELGAPVYPHARFETGIVLDLLERGVLDADGLEFHIVRGKVPQRLEGRDAIETYARTFRLNAFPESYYRRLEADRRSR